MTVPKPLLEGAQQARQFGRPLVIAHRGASGLAPENTLAAFRLAVDLGADGVELDVQLSADAFPVVIHDTRVNRTTDGWGSVSRFTRAELESLDAGAWFERRLMRRPRVRAMTRRLSAGASFAGEPVPTLAETLRCLEPAALERIYIELKCNPENSGELLDAVLSLIVGHSLYRSITLLSFDHQIVRRAKELDRGIRTAATFPARGRRLVSARSIVRSAEIAGVDEIALHFGLATRRAIEVLHERGFSVSVWTANSKLSMRRLVACGVDSIMTNFPNRLRDVLEGGPPRRTR